MNDKFIENTNAHETDYVVRILRNVLTFKNDIVLFRCIDASKPKYPMTTHYIMAVLKVALLFRPLKILM